MRELDVALAGCVRHRHCVCRAESSVERAAFERGGAGGAGCEEIEAYQGAARESSGAAAGVVEVGEILASERGGGASRGRGMEERMYELGGDAERGGATCGIGGAQASVVGCSSEAGGAGSVEVCADVPGGGARVERVCS